MGLIPVSGFCCPSGYKYDDKKLHSFDECLNHCDNKCVAKPILELMVDNLKNDHHRGFHISVTTLLGCLRQTYLERTQPFYPRPLDRNYNALRGTILHTLTEKLDKRKYIIEKDIFYDCNGVKLYGRLDIYDKEEEKLIDIKSCKDIGFDYILREGKAKNDHIKQTNIYKFLMENGQFVDKRYKKRYKVKEIEVIYICMKGIATTGSIYRSKNRGTITEYNINKIPIVPTETVKSFIENKVKILNDAFTENILPEPPDKDTQKWLCGTNYPDMDGYCDVRYNCPFWLEEAERRKIPTSIEDLK